MIDIRESVLVIDTETTGLDPKRHALVELAAVWFIGGQASHSFVARIDPSPADSFEVDPEAARLNGYDPRTWGGMPLGPVLEQFLAFTRGLVAEGGHVTWVGCNPAFDRSFLMEAAERTGIPVFERLSHRMIDVQSIAWATHQATGHRSRRLGDLYREVIGHVRTREHRALTDCYDTMVVLRVLLTRMTYDERRP